LVSTLLPAAAGLSLAAGLFHSLVISEHLAEWWGYGSFFVIISLAQVLYPIALDRWPRRCLFLLGIVGNPVSLLLWLVSRILGIPFVGPDAGQVEAVGPLELLVKFLELDLISVLVWLVYVWPRRAKTFWPLPPVLAFGVGGYQALPAWETPRNKRPW
jgi:hypothetical protein